MYDFQRLNVYLKAKLLNKDIFTLLKNKDGIDYFLKDQLKRASVSIILNIAEGSGRLTNRDKQNFYYMARGSLYECVALLELYLDESIITQNEFESLTEKHTEVSKMLLGLIQSLQVKS